MGILSNSEIVKALESRDLIIDPPPSFGPEEVNTTYDACSVQLQLDSFLNVPEEDLKLIFDLSQPGRLDKTLEMVCKRVEIPSKGYTLAPGQFVLAQTKQVVGFSGKLSGRIESTNSTCWLEG
jgi:deoxycytidine triphosphate deaminase